MFRSAVVALRMARRRKEFPLLGFVPKRLFATESPSTSTSTDFFGDATSSGTGTIAENLFQKIVETLKAGGHVVVLPRKSEEPNEASGYLRPIGALLDLGLGQDTVVDIFATKPELFRVKTEDWVEKVNLLQELGFSEEKTVLTLTRKAEIFKIPLKELLFRLETLRIVGVKGDKLAGVVYRSPELLVEASCEQIRQAANNLKSFFTTEQVIQLFTEHPQVIFQRFDDIEEKYEYIYYEMGLEAKDFQKSMRWVSVPLEYIMMRHEMLARTGAYLRPDPKRPMLTKDNPKPRDIFDTSEYVFSTEVAGVTTEEYQVFKEMFNRQLEMEQKDEEYEERREDAVGEPTDDGDSDDDEGVRIDRDEDDFGGWKKHSGKNYCYRKKPKAPMRKRKGRA